MKRINKVKIFIVYIILISVFSSCFSQENNLALRDSRIVYIDTDKGYVHIEVDSTIVYTEYIENLASDLVMADIKAAVLNEDWDLTKQYLQLLSRPIDESFTQDMYMQAMFDSYLMHLLVDAKFDPNVKLILGDTLLHWAAQENEYDLIKKLINNGADVNATSLSAKDSVFGLLIDKNTPIELVDEFMKAGLNVHYKDAKGNSYIENMLIIGRADLALQFLQYDEVLRSIKDEEALGYWLVYYWNDQTIALCNYLTDNGVVFNNNLPLLHEAIREINYDAFHWLYEQGFDLHKEIYFDGMMDIVTPLEYLRFETARLTRFAGKDYYYTESAPEVQNLRKIEELILQNRN